MQTKTNDHIAYYCFNRTCSNSVYFSKTVRVTDLPLNIETLAADHQCPLCHSRLVSMMDIELKTALRKNNDAARPAIRIANRV